MNQVAWMTEYRKRNLDIAESKPVKNSLYYEVDKLNEFLTSNDQDVNDELPVGLKREGITLLTWDEAIDKHNDIVKKALDNEEKPRNQYEAWINANFNSGFVAIVDGKFSGLHEFKIDGKNNMIAKNLIIIRENTNVNFLERLNGEINLLNETVYVAGNSNACMFRIYNIDDKAIVNQQSILENDSKLLNGNAYLKGNEVHVREMSKLNGQGAWIEQNDLSYLNDNQFYNRELKILHKHNNAKSNIRFRNILDGKARSVFDGMIKIDKSGQKADANLQAHSLLLSKDASSNNIPNLEIEADDVKAGHSASVSNVDEEQLFYLTSRGLNKEEAVNSIIKGFLDSIISKMPVEYHGELGLALADKLGELYEQ